jgi:hypothetical protein
MVQLLFEQDRLQLQSTALVAFAAADEQFLIKSHAKQAKVIKSIFFGKRVACHERSSDSYRYSEALLFLQRFR